MIPVVKAKLLEARKASSSALPTSSRSHGLRRRLRAFGAELAVTYLNDKAKKYVEPLARELEAPIMMRWMCLRRAVGSGVRAHRQGWGGMDFVVHSIAFSPKTRCGRVVDAPRDGFLATMTSRVGPSSHGPLAETADAEGWHAVHHDLLRQPNVVENYNIMGVAKAALESAVRYIAAELGRKAFACTLFTGFRWRRGAASGIPEFDELLDKAKAKAPARSLVSIEDVGMATAFLAMMRRG